MIATPACYHAYECDEDCDCQKFIHVCHLKKHEVIIMTDDLGGFYGVYFRVVFIEYFKSNDS